MDNIDDIYTDIIMEQSQATYNKHELKNKTGSEHGHNPSCGDDITIDILLKDNTIEDLSYTGCGCAISQASTSIMIDLIKGKNIEEAIKLITIFYKMIKNESLTDEELESLEDAQSLKNISHMPQRVKCAELAWKTLEILLNKNQK